MESIALSRAATIMRRRDDRLRTWCKELGIPIELRKFGFRKKRYIAAKDFDRLAAYSDTQPRQKVVACGRLWDSGKDYRNLGQRQRDTELARRIVAASRYKQRTWGAVVYELDIQAELAAMSQ